MIANEDALRVVSVVRTDAAPPPYYTFEYLGERFVYDTTACRFYRIDQATHRFLDLCRTHSVDAARVRLCEQGGLPSDVVESVASEVSILADHGLFEKPDYSISGDQLEQELNDRYTMPWNKLELALSEICNLACKYCYCGTCRDLSPSQGLMSEAVARQAITWLFAMSGRTESVHITFFGGEPLLNKPVFRFVMQYSQRLARLHRKKVSYSMTTNGSLLDDEIIGYIKSYNFGLMVSLDGPPELHDAQCPTRGGGGSFNAVAKGIRKLMARRRAVTVRCTMTHPVPRMLDLIRFFEDFGFTRIVLGRAINPLHPSPVDCTGADFEECSRQEREEIIPWVLQKLAAGEKPKYFPYGQFIAAQDEGCVTPKVSPFKCGACRGTTTVGADGTLYPCHRFVEMQPWRIGDLSQGPDYGRCKQFWRDYRAAIAKDCQSCWLWAQCHGPCPWEIAQGDGSFCSPRSRHCNVMEEYAKRAAYVYFQSKRVAKASLSPPASPELDLMENEKRDSRV